MKKITAYVYQSSVNCFNGIAQVGSKPVVKAGTDEATVRAAMRDDLEALGYSGEQVEFAVDAGEFVAKIVGLASGVASPSAGQYVLNFDPKGGGGRGILQTTKDRARAKVYFSKASFFEVWKNTSLKAFTVEIEPKEKVEVASIES